MLRKTFLSFVVVCLGVALATGAQGNPIPPTDWSQYAGDTYLWYSQADLEAYVNYGTPLPAKSEPHDVVVQVGVDYVPNVLNFSQPTDNYYIQITVTSTDSQGNVIRGNEGTRQRYEEVVQEYVTTVHKGYFNHDTTNIQAAFDAASGEVDSLVQLAPGTFYLTDNVQIKDFDGIFKGAGAPQYVRDAKGNIPEDANGEFDWQLIPSDVTSVQNLGDGFPKPSFLPLSGSEKWIGGLFALYQTDDNFRDITISDMKLKMIGQPEYRSCYAHLFSNQMAYCTGLFGTGGKMPVPEAYGITVYNTNWQNLELEGEVITFSQTDIVISTGTRYEEGWNLKSGIGLSGGEYFADGVPSDDPYQVPDARSYLGGNHTFSDCVIKTGSEMILSLSAWNSILTVENNTYEDVGYMFHMHDMYNCEVIARNNVGKHVTSATDSHNAAGIGIQNGTYSPAFLPAPTAPSSVTITGNKIGMDAKAPLLLPNYQRYTCGIYVGDYGPSLGVGCMYNSVVIADNTISGPATLGSYAYVALLLEQCEDVLVSNNYITGNFMYSLNLYQSTGVTVTGNTLENVNAVYAPISVEESDDCVVKHNTLKNVSSDLGYGGVWIYGDGNTIQGNDYSESGLPGWPENGAVLLDMGYSIIDPDNVPDYCDDTFPYNGLTICARLSSDNHVVESLNPTGKTLSIGTSLCDHIFDVTDNLGTPVYDGLNNISGYAVCYSNPEWQTIVDRLAARATMEASSKKPLLR